MTGCNMQLTKGVWLRRTARAAITLCRSKVSNNHNKAITRHSSTVLLSPLPLPPSSSTPPSSPNPPSPSCPPLGSSSLDEPLHVLCECHGCDGLAHGRAHPGLDQVLECGLRVPVAADGGRLGLLKLLPAPVWPGQAAHLQGRGKRNK